MSSNKKEILAKNLGLVGMTKWMNETYKEKKTGQPFNNSDIQGYINRKKLPEYLGNITIEEVKSEYSNKKYNIVKYN